MTAKNVHYARQTTIQLPDNGTYECFAARSNETDRICCYSTTGYKFMWLERVMATVQFVHMVEIIS